MSGTDNVKDWKAIEFLWIVITNWVQMIGTHLVVFAIWMLMENCLSVPFVDICYIDSLTRDRVQRLYTCPPDALH